VRIGTHAGGTRQSIYDTDQGPPLRETGTPVAVLLEAISKTVKTFGDNLIGRASEGLCAGVDLDAGKDALDRQSLRERCATGALLTDCFVVHDSAADELSGARAGKEHFPGGAPALLGRPDPECIEPFRQGGDGFVRRENPLAPANERQRDAL
jgi:hypothetical protein